jgi:hypothetical protein
VMQPQFCMVLVHDTANVYAYGPFSGALHAVEWAESKCAPRTWRLIYAYQPDGCDLVEVTNES